MRRYVVAGMVQSLAAALVCFIVLASVLDGSSTSGSASAVPISMIVLSVASAASTVLAFLSRSHAGLRLPFVLAELAWTVLYCLPLGAALVNTSQSAGAVPYQGEEPMLGIALALSSAASSAGGAVAIVLPVGALIPHLICLALGVWGLVQTLSAERRGGGVR